MLFRARIEPGLALRYTREQYGGSLVLPDEAEFAADFAERFYDAVSAWLMRDGQTLF